MRLHALIPARAGSRRLPGKNMRFFAGRRLIDWTLAAASESGCCERICVSTDDPLILSHAIESGCDPMPLRPAELASDSASSLAVVLHYLRWLQSESVPVPDRLLLLQPTSPLRDASQIRDAVNYAAKCGNTELVSVTQPTKPLSWLRRVHADTLGDSPFIDEGEVVLLNGAIYLLDCARVLSEERLLGPSPLAWRMPREVSVDIDDRMDWVLAEALARDPGEEAA